MILRQYCVAGRDIAKITATTDDRSACESESGSSTDVFVTILESTGAL